MGSGCAFAVYAISIIKSGLIPCIMAQIQTTCRGLNALDVLQHIKYLPLIHMQLNAQTLYVCQLARK